MKKAKQVSIWALALTGLLSATAALATMPVVVYHVESTTASSAAHESHDVTISADTAPISVEVTLMKGDKILNKVFIKTLDGVTAPVSYGNEMTYVSSASKVGDKTVLDTGTVQDGVFMTVTPTIIKDGKIEMAFFFTKSALTAMNTVKQAGVDVQLPQINSFIIDQRLMMDSGKEVMVPIEVIVPVGQNIDDKYAVKITATKL